jgi:hypothetical protein
MVHFGNHLLDHLSGANVFNIFHTIGSAGGLIQSAGPLFRRLFAVYHGTGPGRADLASVRTDRKESAAASDNETHLAHFTDTFYEINGVALTLQQQVQLAADQSPLYPDYL